jgi:hypothetical protein
MQALANAANALLTVAGAISGKDFSCLPKITTGTQAPSGVTVGEACNDFLRAKARAGRSDRYLRALRVSLGSFSRGRFALPLEAVTVATVEDWLNTGEWAARTQVGYLSDLRTMFNFSVRRGLCQTNPAAAVESPVIEAQDVVIHSPEEVRAVLTFARDYDLNLCRCLAVRYFSGLRSAEADRLRETHFKADHIEVTAANAKTRQRRLVTITPALRAWLNLGGTLDFGDRGNRWRWFVQALKSRTNVDWPHNVTRHSFCSYHLAHFRKASETALEAGHAETMLFKHYREVVTREDAAAFWEVLP